MSVSTVEVDERRGAWRAEAQYRCAPRPQALRAAGVDPALLTVAALPDIDWVAHSLAGLPPVRAGRFTVHGRHDRRKLTPGGVRIEIEAATAFGTGHHATTRSCLLALDRVLKSGRPRQVLDVGSGSGLLAIAAAKVGAKVVATDIDPEAVRVTAANARLNGVAGRVAARLATERGPAALYDLVFANILAGPLVRLSACLSRAVGTGGNLILSGMLRAQAPSVEAAYVAHGLTLAGRLTSGEWTTLVLRRPSEPWKRGAPGTGRACRARLHQSGRKGLVRISGCLRPTPCAGSRSA